MPLASGDNFAGFTIIRQLGSGGMGEVYLVDHPRLPRREALKILPSGVSADTEFRGRFNREAELAATLWHPHIVAVHDRGDHHGQLWITMDFVEGTDAARLLTEQFPAGLPPAFAVEIIAAVADALDYAHERGLLHRDVKPANILLSGTEPEARNRRILLSDFGIAREMEDTAKLTATNMAVGSISYAAPEQLMGQALDGRADQYALAATAFQLLTGRPPFENSNAAVVITSHLSTPPPLMAQRRPDLGVFDPVMNRALAKKPEDRYPSCRDFADALKGVVDGGGVGAGGIAHPTLTATPAAGTADETRAAQSSGNPALAGAQVPERQDASAKPAGRRGVWIAAVAVVAALAIAAVVVIPRFTGSDEETQPDASAAPTSGETTSVEPTSTEQPAALIPASSVESLMLTDAHLSAIVGTPVTIAQTFKEPYDSSPTLSPLSCAAAVVTGEATALGTIQYTAMLQDVAFPGEGQPGNAHVEQTVVLTPSEEAAAQFLSDSTERWQRCSGTVVTNSDPYWTTTPSDVRVHDNVIVLDRPVEGFSVPDFRCQHALGTWSNVIAEGLVCNDGPIGDAAQRIVEDILANAQAG